MKVDQPAVRGEESAACAQLSKSCSSPGGTGVQEEEEEEEEGEKKSPKELEEEKNAEKAAQQKMARPW